MSTLRTDVLKDVAETVTVQVTDLATATTLRSDLANNTNPALGAALVGYESGTVAGTFTERKRGISVLKYGADPTGVVAADTAFANAIAAAKLANTFVYAEGTFRFTSKLVVNAECDFSQADFKFYGQPALAIELSTGSATDPLDAVRGLTFHLPRLVENVDKPVTGWVGSGIGVRTVNLVQCFVYVGTIRGFDEGMRNSSFSAGSGHSYTTFFIKHLDNNRINLNLLPGDALGWVNENLYLGGRFSQNSAEGASVAGARQIKISKATNACNNNLFIKPSIEGNVAEYHVENGGQYNTIQQARWEAAPAKVLYTGDTAQQGTDNIILGGYQSHEIAFTYTLTGAATGNYNQVIGTREQFETTILGHVYMNASGDESPVWRIQQAAQRPEDATTTNYAVRQTAQTHRGKLGADTFDRVLVNYSTPRITFGGGAATQDVGVIRSSANSLQLLSGAQVIPSLDNAVSNGNASFRWSVIFAGTGTINTSDQREKQQVRALSAAERAVAVRLKGLLRAFKFNDAVDKKGNSARIHFGIIAQDVKAAFEVEGLLAENYAVLCYDQWEAQPAQLNEDGSILIPAVEAGDRYGVRYEELLAFIISAL